jgi:hypothetical protein
MLFSYLHKYQNTKPPLGIEPKTFSLQVKCSTTELKRQPQYIIRQFSMLFFEKTITCLDLSNTCLTLFAYPSVSNLGTQLIVCNSCAISLNAYGIST